jgi:hypothetical protein
MRSAANIMCALVCVFILLLGHRVAAEEWTIGRFKLNPENSTPLTRTEELNKALGKKPLASYLRGVGGIAFDSVAEPDSDLQFRDIKVEYQPSYADGVRLHIIIDKIRFKAPVHDWLLVPTALFADSDFSGVFTLFGELDNKIRQEQILSSGGRVLNYAPPFENTLAGLRLFQLDVLLVDRDLAVELPKRANNYVYGSGEKSHDSASAARSHDAYYRGLGELGILKQSWQSYVICDCFQKVTFSTKNGNFSIKGEPFYYFWRTNYDSLRQKEAIALGKTRRLISDSGSFEDLTDSLKLLSPHEALAFMSELTKRTSHLDNEETIEYQYLEEYSLKRNTLNSILSEMNPNVWNAGKTVLQYASFFRYVKQTNKHSWTAFVQKMKTIKIEPQVRTPSTMMGD